MVKKVEKPESAWRAQLTPEQYKIMREKGTERAFTGQYWDTRTAGIYHCAGCGLELFTSGTKFDSGCGWPSFYEAIKSDHVQEESDMSHGMIRTEVMCSACGSHLGHVFEDGPKPTGLRYCINSACLSLDPKK